MKLSAEPLLIIVSPPDTTGTTVVEYDTQSRRTTQLFLQLRDPRRIVPGNPLGLTPPKRLDTANLVPGPAHNQKGRFDLANAMSLAGGPPGLAPGQAADIIALREDFPNQLLDPNDPNPERTLGRITIQAVRDKAINQVPDWLSDFRASRKEVGGTYYYRELQGTRKFQMFVRMSRQPPVLDSVTGLNLLTNEISQGRHLFSNYHAIEVTGPSGLDSGADYYAVVRLIDRGGVWWEFLDGPAGVSPFKTKQRQITVVWERVDVLELDEDGGELRARLSLFEAPSDLTRPGNESGKLVFNEANLFAGMIRTFTPAKTMTSGPKPVDDSNRRAYLETQGREIDGGFLDPSEITHVVTLPLNLPVGRGREAVSATPFDMESRDLELDTGYTARGMYQVDYL